MERTVEESKDASSFSISAKEKLRSYLNCVEEIPMDNNFEDEMSHELDDHLQMLQKKILLDTDCSGKRVVANAGASRGEENDDDDSLYDPNLDEEDQDWVDEKRRSYMLPNQGKLPTSDAVLNCPACMSLLCLDCQRHELYKTQYRAMFVSNCRVDFGQSLRYPAKKTRKKSSDEAAYHPVACAICNTDVAVYDRREIYHFFNVIASYS